MVAADLQPPQQTHAQSLEKLMEHIESLQKSNHEMSSALKAIIDGNKDKLKSMMSSKIEPWIKSLKIPDEHQNAFMQGIEAACHEGQYKGMADFEKNPAFTVACAAAAAHGEATQEAEKHRLQLQEFMKDAEEKNTRQQKQVDESRSDECRMLYAAATQPNNAGNAGGGSALGKRAVSEVYTDSCGEMNSSECWSTVFSGLRG